MMWATKLIPLTHMESNANFCQNASFWLYCMVSYKTKDLPWVLIYQVESSDSMLIFTV